jgi:CRP/FNR family cyclic AMP-dependent transcriptional regulator
MHCQGFVNRQSKRSRKIFAMPTEQESAALAILRRVSIFSGLSEQEFAFLTSHVFPRKYSSGELVFSEGDVCAGLYIVQSGNVRIFKSSAGGREQVLSIDGPGSSIAELPVFDGGNYPASAQAVSDSTLLFFSRQDFQALCVQHPEVALKVLRVVGARLRRLVGIIEELSFTTVRHRLIALLVRLGKTEGVRNDNRDSLSLTLPSNNSELAAQIGTVRELVSRNLSRLQAEGLIEVDNRKLEIPSLKRLQAELKASGG